MGSFVFHATMLYEAQMADELPMIYVSSYSLFVLYDTTKGFDYARNGAVPLYLTWALLNIFFTLS